MSETKVAVVTGANRGIGFATVKGLCQRFNGKVYLTARNEERGHAAVESLKQIGFYPVFHQLDITDQESIDRFRDNIKATDGGIDILVNNAAILYPADTTVPFREQAKTTLNVNYFSTGRVCKALFPLLRENAQVVHLSSVLGHLSRIPSPEIRSQLNDPDLTLGKLSKLMEQFVTAADEDKHIERGWPNSAYMVSKVGITAMTFVQQRKFDTETEERNISVNCVHPGYVNTGLTGNKGPMTPDEGARASLYLALEPHGYSGQFVWRDFSVIDWTGYCPDA